MKIDYAKIIGYWILILSTMCAVLWLSSCATPNPKKQAKHWEKFLYYGGKIDTVKQTLTKEILIKGKDGRDSLIYVDVEVSVPTPVINYRDRWHTRRMDKRERDSMRHVERVLKVETTKAQKLAQIERKRAEKLQKELTKQERLKNKRAIPLFGWIVILIFLILSALYVVKGRKYW